LIHGGFSSFQGLPLNDARLPDFIVRGAGRELGAPTSIASRDMGPQFLYRATLPFIVLKFSCHNRIVAIVMSATLNNPPAKSRVKGFCVCRVQIESFEPESLGFVLYSFDKGGSDASFSMVRPYKDASEPR
jgi:hypothetical protein